MSYLSLINNVRLNVPLAQMSWMGVGGSASALFTPCNQSELISFIKAHSDHKMTTIGACSNVLISDAGIDGAVIKLGSDFKSISIADEYINAGAGALVADVAKVAFTNSISGFEFFSNIPGTVGGAISMNAGCYGCSSEDVVEKVDIIDASGRLISLHNNEIDFCYRGNALTGFYVVSNVLFKGKKLNKDLIKSRTMELRQKRKSTQPINHKTTGCVFKNPEMQSAWKLIDDAGCRGMVFGGAHISKKHCNFIINNANASAEDIWNLIKKVRAMVKNKTGIFLELEIKLLGNF
ncbi:UDP-N-acetylenolpyruvoylglucosamine reductase [Candidatus Xenohaliotis californiensis]|uniref:UDP-N-acetylenolpyruvoylglucosamine reductase n=1 Tax=Candidatus Xenohaliotis californiensis TaxID=84677 RepID=A0ABM9N8X2_9RICK|nr:UDP-N-acetylenolpyruvoylglucosamine reductase [Candidatus Xenohaliotis californiensis]